MNRPSLLACWVALVTGTTGSLAQAAPDWPMYRADTARSGYTVDRLETDPQLLWRWIPNQPPDPAWSGRDTRMPLDEAFHPVVSGGLVFFGSSADCRIRALDLTDGRLRWSFATDAPIRFSPAVADNRLLVVSDDGHLYCLDCLSGALLWKLRGGPTSEMLLGNDRMISRHPARGGPVVRGETVYFAAGIWPSEGIYIYAVDLRSGRVRWCNDTAGTRAMDQPHPTAFAKSGISAQGNLVLAGDTLLVPTGRGVPASFDAETGKFRYFHLQANGRLGGAEVVAADDLFFNDAVAFDVATGMRQKTPTATVPSVTAVPPEAVVTWADRKLQVCRRTAAGELVLDREIEVRFGGAALVVADQTAISAGPGSDAGYGVELVDLATGESLGSLPMASEPLGLAVAEGRLLVSTSQGTIACYGHVSGDTQPHNVDRTETAKSEATADASMREVVSEIIRRTNITEGYCLDLGCGDGGLAIELARRTGLVVYAIDPNPENVAAARRRAAAAGLEGTRVTVHQAPLDAIPYPNYFANLIVSARALGEVDGAPDFASLGDHRCLRPFGGVACQGPVGQMRTFTRGPIDGGGDWTHQYCDAANSNCSADTVVAGPLGMLWFGDLDFPMPSRHGRGNAPLFLDGRLFVEGLDAVRAVDAYNGRTLWEYPLPGIQAAYDADHIVGVSGIGGNYCLAPDRLYVHHGTACLALDPATGELLDEFTAPDQSDGEPGHWGSIACVGDLLLGSVVNPEHTVHWTFREADMSEHFTESSTLFAMDRHSGQVKWTYVADDSIRHNAIAVAAGKVFCIDRPLATFDRNDVDAAVRRGEAGGPPIQPPGKLVALDAKTGERLWTVEDQIDGTTVAVSQKHDVLVMAYQDTRFKIASERGGRMAAFRASTGEPLWDVEAKYQSRLILNDRTIYAQPGAWDLLTGQRKDFTFARSYGCGTLAGSANMLLYRSATLGYTDLNQQLGNEDYGGIRPGCWINTLPVGGIVLMPDATDRCTCSYLLKASIALEPHGLRPPTINPPGGTFREELDVVLSASDDRSEIRYTLDGTPPTTDSPRYTRPIAVAESANLRAKTFRVGYSPSTTAAATFTLDPTLIPLTGPEWRVIDAPGAVQKESRWQLSGDAIVEVSNYFVGAAGEASPTVERPGTYRLYEPGLSWRDGQLTLELASTDNDGLGVAFRCRDADHHYLWAIDQQRQFHILAVKRGDDYRVLDQRVAGYSPNQWHRVCITLSGDEFTVEFDGQRTHHVRDATLTEGSFSLYSWGSNGAKFRAVRWMPAGKPTDSTKKRPARKPPSLLDTPPTDLPPWQPLSYATSDRIRSVSFDATSRRTEARGSDIWPITWADDDAQYSAFGDGGGFSGSNQDGRASLGVARIEGDLANYHGSNVWGGKDALQQPTFTGKGTGIVSIDGVLYMWVGRPKLLAETGLAVSRDHARSWQLLDWHWTMHDRLFAGALVNCGRDHAAAPDEYVYACFTRIETPELSDRGWIYERPGRVDLARAPRDRVVEESAWQWLAGLDHERQPRWTADIARRQPTFEDPNGVKLVSVCYQPAIGLYLLTYSPRDNSGNFAMFEARRPWGPWQMVDYRQQDPLFMPPEPNQRVAAFHFAPKWWSADGTEFGMVFNVGDDAWNTVGGRLELSETLAEEVR